MKLDTLVTVTAQNNRKMSLSIEKESHQIERKNDHLETDYYASRILSASRGTLRAHIESDFVKCARANKMQIASEIY